MNDEMNDEMKRCLEKSETFEKERVMIILFFLPS